MEDTARLVRFPSITAPLVALVVGAGVATGAYALIDDDGSRAGKSQSSIELRGSKASERGIPSPSAAEALRTDPHGPAFDLRNP
jgi:hypothetical protein